jgi:hypothetical protein
MESQLDLAETADPQCFSRPDRIPLWSPTAVVGSDSLAAPGAHQRWTR